MSRREVVAFVAAWFTIGSLAARCLKSRDDSMQAVLAEAASKLPSLVSGPQYPALLESLILEALTQLADTKVVVKSVQGQEAATKKVGALTSSLPPTSSSLPFFPLPFTSPVRLPHAESAARCCSLPLALAASPGARFRAAQVPGVGHQGDGC